MAVLKHFVITYFNLGLWGKDKYNVSTQTEDWLKKRFDLFDKYCFPSVKSQTNNNFIWLCLFDSKTPEFYLKKINSYKNDLSQFHPCFLNEEETTNLMSTLRNLIKKHLAAEDEYIVTTNLDNDDVFHSRMIEVLQSNIIEKHKVGIYSFNYGYQYFTDLNVVMKMRYPNNSFITLVQKNDENFETIRSYPHTQARKHFDNIDIKGRAFWIEIIHDSNVANDVIITIKIRYYFLLRTISFKDFGIDFSVKWYQNIYGILVKLPIQTLTVVYRKLKKKTNKRK